MGKWKAFTPSSLNVLLSSVVQIKQMTDANTTAVVKLYEDLQRLESYTTNAINNMNENKQEKITGTLGQVAGFDKLGNMVAQDGVATMDQVNIAIQKAIGAIEAALSEV